MASTQDSTRRRQRQPQKLQPQDQQQAADDAAALLPSPARPLRPRGAVAAFFANAAFVYGAAAGLRIVLLLYGLWQDAHSPIKYTDIDYLVFTDAARFVARGQSPYARETYRYTPLLAWLLLPAGRAGAGFSVSSSSSSSATDSSAAEWLVQAQFASGKLLFAAADLVAGWLLERVLQDQLLNKAAAAGQIDDAKAAAAFSAAVPARARMYASVWLLNPMVAAISTRGSSEGLLGALVAALLWAVQVAQQPTLAGVLLGVGVHLKIYPFIYAPAIFWWMDGDERLGRRSAAARSASSSASASAQARFAAFLTPDRLRLTLASLVSFASLNALMFASYGYPFLQHTFLHHVTRIDHRHNFSPYNTQLYMSSAATASSPASDSSFVSATGCLSAAFSVPIESLAFLPQLLLSAVLLPLVLAKKDLASTMLAQTFAFVAFNKVCTSQYFLWYMVLLPAYLPRSSFVANRRTGVLALVLWIAGQAAWLQQGYELEFLGQSTFVPGLWLASVAFFSVNCWILGVIVGDVAETEEE